MFEQYIPHAIAALVGFVSGGGAIAYVKSRPVTTKAEAMKLATKAIAELGKVPGAAEAHALAMEQLDAENRAAAGLAAALGKVATVPAAAAPNAVQA